MKLCLLLILTLLLLSTPAFGELTNADLDKISTMLKESEARMKEYVSQEIAKVNLRIDALDNRLTGEIRSVDKRFDDMNKRLDDMNKRLDNQFTLILALFAFLAVVIGIPQILVALQRRHQRAQDEKIEAQQQQIETLIAEIETLKQQASSS